MASLLRLTVYARLSGVRVVDGGGGGVVVPPDTFSATSSSTKLVCALASSTPVKVSATGRPANAETSTVRCW